MKIELTTQEVESAIAAWLSTKLIGATVASVVVPSRYSTRDHFEIEIVLDDAPKKIAAKEPAEATS